MAKTQLFARLTNFETGEEKSVRTGYPGLQMAVTSKIPTLNSMNCALCMAYIAADPSAVKLKGPDLLTKTVDFFMQWDYEEFYLNENGEEVTFDENGEEILVKSGDEDAPLGKAPLSINDGEMPSTSGI